MAAFTPINTRDAKLDPAGMAHSAGNPRLALDISSHPHDENVKTRDAVSEYLGLGETEIVDLRRFATTKESKERTDKSTASTSRKHEIETARPSKTNKRQKPNQPHDDFKRTESTPYSDQFTNEEECNPVTCQSHNRPAPENRKHHQSTEEEVKGLSIMNSFPSVRCGPQNETDQENKSNDQRTIKPVVRKPFPNRIQDRSPIFGASSSTALRTCFRIGEALNSGSQAVRAGSDVIIELYARVSSSWCEPSPRRRQHFTFKDIYHNNPPHLSGTFEISNQLGELDDNKTFLKPAEGGNGSSVCRVIGKLKRAQAKWKLEILNIRQVSLDDVDFVAGIYATDAKYCIND